MGPVIYIYTIEHCKKKFSDFPVTSRDVTNQTLPGGESAGESLVSDIPAGDGEIAKLFFTV
jgi:hypothetical protein